MHKKRENGNDMTESRDLETEEREKEDAKLMLLKCPEMKRRREELVCSKWANTDEDIAYRKIITCTNVTKIKSTGKYLFKTTCKWEIKVRGGHKPSELSWKLKCKIRKWTESRNSFGAVVIVIVSELT
jgi:hypothetical protein